LPTLKGVKIVPEQRNFSYIKVCGITSVADALAVVGLGVNVIGLVFYASSPRAVSIPIARDIVRAVGPFVTTVGLFVNADKSDIETVLQQVSLQVLQFHGDETSSFCKQFNRPWIKALRVKQGFDVQVALQQYRDADAILLDSYKDGVPGGTGETLVWSDIPKNIDIPVILAGGLNPGNVEKAISILHPYAVDVSSGVEKEPGKKDKQKVKAFIEAVHRVH
jgi:phosphoribosylanthranilate isomerase